MHFCNELSLKCIIKYTVEAQTINIFIDSCIVVLCEKPLPSGYLYMTNQTEHLAWHVGTLSHFLMNWADIQRRGSILAWIVILSVADTIAEVKLFLHMDHVQC